MEATFNTVNLTGLCTNYLSQGYNLRGVSRVFDQTGNSLRTKVVVGRPIDKPSSFSEACCDLVSSLFCCTFCSSEDADPGKGARGMDWEEVTLLIEGEGKTSNDIMSFYADFQRRREQSEEDPLLVN